VLVVTFDGQTFSFAFDIADPAQFSALLREIVHTANLIRDGMNSGIG
jgi:hypothetical protein